MIDTICNKYLKFEHHLIHEKSPTDYVTKIRTQMKASRTHHELGKFFSKPKTTEKFVTISQLKYTQLFMMMYLEYVNEIITKQLVEGIGKSKENKVGYIISVEKLLLDNYIGPQRAQKEWLIGSGIIKECDESRKVRVLSQGDGILPKLEQMTGLNFGLRSYFVVAQLHERYIQLTLHHVVKTSANESYPSSIIVQDEMIPIENVNDALCKTIWNNVRTYSRINYCTTHKNALENPYDYYSIKNYKYVLKNIRKHATEIVSYWLLQF